jgi:hypothetical protein
LWDVRSDNLEAGIEVMIYFIRTNMLGHRVDPFVREDPDAIVVKDSWQFVVIVTTEESYVWVPFEECGQLSFDVRFRVVGTAVDIQRYVE